MHKSLGALAGAVLGFCGVQILTGLHAQLCISARWMQLPSPESAGRKDIVCPAAGSARSYPAARRGGRDRFLGYSHG